jgi:hypothetical protein
MRPKIINTFTKAPTKALAKQLNLTFDKKFGYCTSDAYNDDKGYPIPTYITINFEVYGLTTYIVLAVRYYMIINEKINDEL